MSNPRAQVALGFKAFDAHELLVHAVALRRGLYTRSGLLPRLVDTSTAPSADLDPQGITVACGSALLARARSERPDADPGLVLAACTVPMFWLCALAGGPTGVEPGARIAGFPEAAPPAAFLRRMLRATGLDPASDVTVSPCRDDLARLGLLRTCDADLALVSSALLPLEDHGLLVVADVGTALGAPLPSTGLAVGQGLRTERPAVVDRLTEIHREALGLLHADSHEARNALHEVFGLRPEALVTIRERMTPDGAVPADGHRNLGDW